MQRASSKASVSDQLEAWRRQACSKGLLLPSAGGLECADSGDPGSRPLGSVLVPNNQGTVVKEPCSSALCGVSLSYLRALAETLDPSWVDDTTDLLHKVVLPLVRGSSSTGTSADKPAARFWDLIPRKHTGMPQYMVVHAWAANLQQMVAQLDASLSCGFSGVQAAGHKEKPETYVWLGALVVTSAQKGFDPALTKDVVKMCNQGAVLVLDTDQLVISRMRCMWELWAAAYHGQHHRIRIAYPDGMSFEQLMAFEQSCQKLDALKCQASNSNDKNTITSAVKGSVGVKLMTQLLVEAMQRCARISLHFSSGLQGKALYCALLLHGGEFCRCLQVLSNLDGLGLDDDDRMFEDMKGIFNLYSNGTGELGKEEFVEVLCNTGFTEDEALEAYDAVNTDGTGGVSIDEWQHWWLSNRKQVHAPRSKRVAMVASSLAERVDKMAQLVQRNSLPLLARTLRDFHDKLQDPSFIEPQQTLQASPLRGDWKSTVDQCMYLICRGTYREPLNLLWELLMNNADLLGTDPWTMPSPQQLRDDVSTVQGLQLYLQHLAGLLAHMPGRRAQAEYILKCAGNLNARPGTSSGADRPKPGKYDAARFALLRNMVEVKYGKGQHITEALVAEAEKALGVVSAAREVTPGGFSNTLQSSYLHCKEASKNLRSVTGRKQVEEALSIVPTMTFTITGSAGEVAASAAKELAALTAARKMAVACLQQQDQSGGRKVAMGVTKSAGASLSLGEGGCDATLGGSLAQGATATGSEGRARVAANSDAGSRQPAGADACPAADAPFRRRLAPLRTASTSQLVPLDRTLGRSCALPRPGVTWNSVEMRVGSLPGSPLSPSSPKARPGGVSNAGSPKVKLSPITGDDGLLQLPEMPHSSSMQDLTRMGSGGLSLSNLKVTHHNSASAVSDSPPARSLGSISSSNRDSSPRSMLDQMLDTIADEPRSKYSISSKGTKPAACRLLL